MKISNEVSATIDKLPNGYVFTCSDFMSDVDNAEAVIKALNRMVQSGKIAKLSKGKFYKPESSPFGDLLPGQMQIVKDLLEDDGRIVGYLTGYSVYNQFGLTSQVSNTIQIGKNEIRPGFKRERYTISFIRQKNIVSKSNIPLLQILDCIRYIKKIPDTTISISIQRLLNIVNELYDNDRNSLVKLALKYPPFVRALLGAMLDELHIISGIDQLRKSLNPITKYKLIGVDRVIGTADKWNII